MPGGLTTAVGLKDGVGEGGGFAEAGGVAGAADGVDGLVLEEEDLFGAGPSEVVGDELILQVEGGLVGDAAEPLDGIVARFSNGGEGGFADGGGVEGVKVGEADGDGVGGVGGGVTVRPRRARTMEGDLLLGGRAAVDDGLLDAGGGVFVDGEPRWAAARIIAPAGAPR